MYEKEFQEWFERNKKWLYSSDHMQAAYHAWSAGVLHQHAVQQSVQVDGACACPDNGNLQINSDFVCAVCGKTPRR